MISAYGSKWSLDLTTTACTSNGKSLFENGIAEKLLPRMGENSGSAFGWQSHILVVTSGIICETNGQEKESQSQPKNEQSKKK